MPKRELVDIAAFLLIVVVLAVIAVGALGHQLLREGNPYVGTCMEWTVERLTWQPGDPFPAISCAV